MKVVTNKFGEDILWWFRGCRSGLGERYHVRAEDFHPLTFIFVEVSSNPSSEPMLSVGDST